MNEDHMHFGVVKWGKNLFFGIMMILGAFIILFLLMIFLSLLNIISVIIVIFLLLLGAQIFYTGIVGKEFQQVVECLQANNVHLDIFKMMIQVSFNDEIFYILNHQYPTPFAYWILFTHGLFGQEAPPDHIQVWTVISWPVSVEGDPYVLAKKLRRPGIKGIFFQPWIHAKPPDNPLSDDLKEYQFSASFYIPSLYYIGLTEHRGTTNLTAILRRDAKTKDIVQTIHKLVFIKNKIKNEDF